MFVPVDLFTQIIADMKTVGRSRQPQKPWLGVHTQESHGRLFVVRILTDGPADRAKLQVGDLILKVNKKPISGQADFYRKIWELGDAGVKVPLSILRGTEIQEFTVLSADRYQYLKPRAEAKEKKEEI